MKKVVPLGFDMTEYQETCKKLWHKALDLLKGSKNELREAFANKSIYCANGHDGDEVIDYWNRQILLRRFEEQKDWYEYSEALDGRNEKQRQFEYQSMMAGLYY